LRAVRLSLLLCLLGCVLLVPSGKAATDEPFFPGAGNRGYDVRAYEIGMDYYGPRKVVAYVSIEIVALRRLSRIALDFRGPRVAWMTGPESGSYRRRDGKLIFFPDLPIDKGSRFFLEVAYSGAPPTITDPDGSQEGWYRTDDGVVALGEPLGTAAWIPCNNTPADKARFSFNVTVPRSLTAVANGRYAGRSTSEGRTRFIWVEDSPMSPYLAVLNIGRGRLLRSRIGPLKSWTLIDPRLAAAQRPLARLPEVVRFLSDLYGPYPFESAGSIVDFAPELGYALETQSRPFYAFVPDLNTVVHETAHQWFGNSVGIQRWPQIWLNEGFATWSEWYYAEHHGGRSAAAIFRRLYRVPASNERFWNPPPARPGSPENLFATSTYVRGGMALQALRQEIGTRTMLRLLRRWAASHRHGSANIGEFTALAEQLSGRQLDSLFRRWLYKRGKP
jgi:aminopeptidase N